MEGGSPGDGALVVALTFATGEGAEGADVASFHTSEPRTITAAAPAPHIQRFGRTTTRRKVSTASRGAAGGGKETPSPSPPVVAALPHVASMACPAMSSVAPHFSAQLARASPKARIESQRWRRSFRRPLATMRQSSSSPAESSVKGFGSSLPIEMSVAL